MINHPIPKYKPGTIIIGKYAYSNLNLNYLILEILEICGINTYKYCWFGKHSGYHYMKVDVFENKIKHESTKDTIILHAN